MMSQQDAEYGLVSALVRHQDEANSTALARLARLPHFLTEDMVQDKKCRQLLTAILKHASRDIATNVTLGAQVSGFDEFELRGLVEATDPEALSVYVDNVIHYARQRELRARARAAVGFADNDDPDAALDAINREFAGMATTDEASIGTIPDQAKIGHEFLMHLQSEIKSSKPRVAFPIANVRKRIPLILPTQMILLTAKTKVGKTSFASQMFDFNIRAGLRGAYFHFEDAPGIMYARRIARNMARYVSYTSRGMTHTKPIASLEEMLGKPDDDGNPTFLSDEKLETVNLLREGLTTEFSDRGIEIHCAKWSMDRVCRTWRRLHRQALLNGHEIAFVVIDYLNKAALPTGMNRASDIYNRRGQDAELVKQTAEDLNSVAILLQQENDDGLPFETRMGLHKSQAWLSIQRERYDNGELQLDGNLVIKNANIGRTGTVPIRLLPQFLVWV